MNEIDQASAARSQPTDHKPAVPRNVHVRPAFGRKHELSPGCWCHPKRDPQAENLIVHNVEQ